MVATSKNTFLVDVDDNLTTTATRGPGYPNNSLQEQCADDTCSHTADLSGRCANGINLWDAKRSRKAQQVLIWSFLSMSLTLKFLGPTNDAFIALLFLVSAHDACWVTGPSPAPLKRNAGHFNLGSKSLSSRQDQEEEGLGEARVRVFVFDDLVVFDSPGPGPSTSSDSIASRGGGTVATGGLP